LVKKKSQRCFKIEINSKIKIWLKVFPLHLAAFEQPAPSPGAVRDSQKEGGNVYADRVGRFDGGKLLKVGLG
jgi:hypothetical protein